MSTTEELLQLLINAVQNMADKQQTSNDNMQAGFNNMQIEIQAGFSNMQTEIQAGFSNMQTEIQAGFSNMQTEIQAGFNKLNTTFQKSLPAPVESLLSLECIQGIVESLESSTFDWNAWPMTPENNISSLGRFLSTYGCQVEGHNDIYVREQFSSFPKNLSQFQDIMMVFVLCGSDLYAWETPIEPESSSSTLSGISTGESQYLQLIKLNLSKSHKTLLKRGDLLNEYCSLLPAFKNCIPFGATMLNLTLQIITKTDIIWFPRTFTEQDCEYRVRSRCLDNIVSNLSIMTGRSLSICQQRPLKSGQGKATKVDISIMEKDIDYYVIEVKQYPLIGEVQRSKDLSKLKYKDFPERTKKSIEQLVGYEIRSGCGIGVITDSFFYIFVEVDFEYLRSLPLKKRKYVNNRYPFKYYVSSRRSGHPSTLQLLMLSIYRAVMCPLHDELRAHLETISGHGPENIRSSPISSSTGHSSPGSQGTSSQILSSSLKTPKRTTRRKRSLEEPQTPLGQKVRFNENEKLAYSLHSEDLGFRSLGEASEETSVAETSVAETSTVHSKDALVILLNLDTLTKLTYTSEPKNLVYKTKAKYLRDALLDSFDDNEELVIKIFVKDEVKAYNTEKRATELLSKDPRFNNCYIRHKHGLARVFEKEQIRGPFLISKYIKDTKIFSGPEYKAIEEQVKVLFDNGIMHVDMIRDNMIYNAEEDKIYLIDFERVVFGNEENPYSLERYLNACLDKVKDIGYDSDNTF